MILGLVMYLSYFRPDNEVLTVMFPVSECCETYYPESYYCNVFFILQTLRCFHCFRCIDGPEKPPACSPLVRKDDAVVLRFTKL